MCVVYVKDGHEYVWYVHVEGVIGVNVCMWRFHVIIPKWKSLPEQHGALERPALFSRHSVFCHWFCLLQRAGALPSNDMDQIGNRGSQPGPE